MCENTSTRPAEETEAEPSHEFRVNRDLGCMFIAALQILGGLFGIWITLASRSLLTTNVLQGIVLIPFPWGIYAGILMLLNRRRGVTHSLVLQALQVPTLWTASLSYSMFLGMRFCVGWVGEASITEWYFGAGSYIGFAPGYFGSGAAFNVVAMAALGYLIWVRFKLRRSRSKSPAR